MWLTLVVLWIGVGGWGRKTVRRRHCSVAVAGRFVASAGVLGLDDGSDAELVARSERDVLDQVADELGAVAVRGADRVAGVGGAGRGESAERLAGA